MKQDKTTSEQVSQVPNPKGNGGFKDHPEHINAGGRPRNQESFTYWMNHFKNMNSKDFLDWENQVPEEERSVAADLAYARVRKARADLREFQEVADRTEGKARQSVEFSGGENIGVNSHAVLKEIAEAIKHANQDSDPQKPAIEPAEQKPTADTGQNAS